MATAKEFLNGLGVQVVEHPAALFALSGASNVYNKGAGVEVFLYGIDGRPVEGMTVVGLFPDGNGFDPVVTSAAGRAEFDFGASSAYNPPASGPIRLLITDKATKEDGPPKQVKFNELLADELNGFGDVNGVHTFWSIQLVERQTQPAPVPPVPVLADPLADSLRNLAWNKLGVDLNRDAALFKAAEAHGSSYPLGGEFSFRDAAGKVYVGQMFAGGIVYCVLGDWDHVQKIDWL